MAKARSQGAQPVPDPERAPVPVGVVQADAPEIAPAGGHKDADGELGAQEPGGGAAGAPIPAVINGDMAIGPRHPG